VVRAIPASGSNAPPNGLVDLVAPRWPGVVATSEALFLVPVHGGREEDLVVDAELRAAKQRRQDPASRRGERLDENALQALQVWLMADVGGQCIVVYVAF